MSRSLVIFAVFLLLLVGAAYFVLGNNPGFSAFNGKTASVKGQTIKLEIADTDEERIRGLSGRASLADNAGMLFIFEKPDRYQFWMKDVRFSLDIIFIKENRIITIHRNISPIIKEGASDVPNLTIYGPSELADTVLEVRGGFSDKYGIKEGDIIEISL